METAGGAAAFTKKKNSLYAALKYIKSKKINKSIKGIEANQESSLSDEIHFVLNSNV